MLALPVFLHQVGHVFPPPLESYGDSQMTSLWSILQHRIQQQPLNLWDTLLFLGAILHAFFTHRFLHWSHLLEERQRARRGVQESSGAGVSRRSTGARVL